MLCGYFTSLGCSTNPYIVSVALRAAYAMYYIIMVHVYVHVHNILWSFYVSLHKVH